MAKKKPRRRPAPTPPKPPRAPVSVTARPLVVQFTDSTQTEFAPGALAEFRGRLVVVGRGNEIEAEYQRGLVKGWRYVEPKPTT